MADTTGISTQKINELATTNSPSNSDNMIIDTDSGTRIINYNDLANTILNRLTTKPYTIGETTQTIVGAITSMVSQVSSISSKIGKTSDGNIANCASVTMSNSVSMTAPEGRNQFLVLVDGYVFTVWFPDDDNTRINIGSYKNEMKSALGPSPQTIEGVTFTRSGRTLTVSAPNVAATIFA